MGESRNEMELRVAQTRQADATERLAELTELQELERRIPSLENKAAVASGEGATLYAGVAGALTARRDALLDRLWPDAYPDPAP